MKKSWWKKSDSYLGIVRTGTTTGTAAEVADTLAHRSREEDFRLATSLECPLLVFAVRTIKQSHYFTLNWPAAAAAEALEFLSRFSLCD